MYNINIFKKLFTDPENKVIPIRWQPTGYGRKMCAREALDRLDIEDMRGILGHLLDEFPVDTPEHDFLLELIFFWKYSTDRKIMKYQPDVYQEKGEEECKN